MNDRPTELSLERRVASVYADMAPSTELTHLLDDVLITAGRTRQRPRWLAILKEPPMRLASNVAVGSPTARVAAIVAATLLMVMLATGAVVAGASLLSGPGPIVVAQDGSGTVATIAEAVAMAVDGDTILIKPGTYAEAITVDKDITIRGDGERSTVVIAFPGDGSTHPLFGFEPFAYGLLLDGSDANVENLTVRGPSVAGGEITLSALIIAGGAPVIEGIDIVLDGDRWDYGDGGYYRRSAIQMEGGSTALIRDSAWDGYTQIGGTPNSPTFEGNVVTGQHIAVNGYGQEPVIRGNTFLEGAAIRWDDTGSSGIAEDNDIHGWIGVDASNDPIIRGNRITQPDAPPADSFERGAAIQIASGSTPLVEGNEITDSPYGIEVTGFGATPEIRGNTIRGSVNAAIVIESGAAPTIEGNVLEGNGSAIEVVGTSKAVITGNTLCGNGTDLEVPEGSALTLDASNRCEAAAQPAG